MYVRNQRGAVSLITVSLMSILILVLTVAMVRLMAGELHQATDLADSVKAYYTAQGVAEDTAEQLRVQLAAGTTNLSQFNHNCGSLQATGAYVYSMPSVLSVGSVDCVQVATDINTVTDQIPVNQSRTYDLTNSTLATNGYITRLVLSWDDLATSAGGPFTSALNGNAWQCNTVSSGSCYGNQPPTLQLGVTNYYPGQQAGGVDSTYSGYLVLAPQCSGSGCSAPTTRPQFHYDCHLLATGSLNPPDCTAVDSPYTPLIQVQCSGGAPKRCVAEIDNLVPPARQGYRTVVSITPLFHDTQLNMSAYAYNPGPNNPAPLVPSSNLTSCLQADGTNNLAATDCLTPITLTNALIDVTASVGDTNRRVQLAVPMLPSQALNNVLQGDSDICKSFLITNNGGASYEVYQPSATDPKPACKIAN